MSSELAPKSQEKHEALNDAIDNIGTAIARATALYERIMNESASIDEAEESPNRSLNDILDRGPSRIYNKTEQILGLLTKIEEAIF